MKYDQDQVVVGGLVRDQRLAHLGEGGGAGIVRADHLERVVLDAVAGEAFLQHGQELVEGDAVAAFGAALRPVGIGHLVEQRCSG